MSLPAPLTPPDCDLRDFPRMMLDVNRLFGSGFNAKASRDPLAWMVGHKLWYRSWHQVPAASLPDDDEELCYLAELGFDLATFRQVKELAMRGWVKCSDGRLYHTVIAEAADAAWKSKCDQRYATECARIKKHNQRHRTDIPFPDYAEFVAAGFEKVPLPVPQDNNSASTPCPPGQTEMSPGTSADVPRENSSKGEGEGKGEGKGEVLSKESPSDSPASRVDTAFDRYCALRSEVVPKRRAISLSPERRKALTSRLAEIGGLDAWDDVLAIIRASPFLRGDTARSGFVAEIDWILKPANLTKLREGNYDDHRASNGNGAPHVRPSTVDSLIEARAMLGIGR